ncbi:hypothetical protein ACFX14_029370 [Malus domestica]
MEEWGQQCLQVQLCTWHVVESLGQVDWDISASEQPTVALENMVLLELVRSEHAGGERKGGERIKVFVRNLQQTILQCVNGGGKPRGGQCTNQRPLSVHLIQAAVSSHEN